MSEKDPKNREDTMLQGTVDTTRDRNRGSSQQQGSGQPQRQQQQRSPSGNPGGGEPEVQENLRDRESSTGSPRHPQVDSERGGSGGDLPM
jgi:hypothetical protein